MSIHGYVDRFDTTIAGWALDHEAPDEVLEISVERAGVEIYRCTADLHRGDLASVSASVNHGFSFDPASIDDFNIDAVLDVFAHGRTKHLLGGGYWVRRKVVVEGLEGWLFLDNDSNHVNQRIAAEIDVSDDVIQQTALLFATRQAMLKVLDIPYQAFVMPEKNVVCQKYFPDLIVSDHRPVPLIAEAAKNFGSSFIYPVESFTTNPEKYFTRVDTHAGVEGYRLAFELIKAALPTLFEVSTTLADIENLEFTGDLGAKMWPPRTEKVNEVHLPNDEQFYYRRNEVINLFQSGSTLRGEVVSIHNANAQEKKLLIFGTSSAFYGLPLFSACFRETIFVWENTFDYNIIKKFSPDCVLWIATERFLPTSCDDIRGLPAALSTVSKIIEETLEESRSIKNKNEKVVN